MQKCEKKVKDLKLVLKKLCFTFYKIWFLILKVCFKQLLFVGESIPVQPHLQFNNVNGVVFLIQFLLIYGL